MCSHEVTKMPKYYFHYRSDPGDYNKWKVPRFHKSLIHLEEPYYVRNTSEALCQNQVPVQVKPVRVGKIYKKSVKQHRCVKDHEQGFTGASSESWRPSCRVMMSLALHVAPGDGSAQWQPPWSTVPDNLVTTSDTEQELQERGGVARVHEECIREDTRQTVIINKMKNGIIKW